MKLFSRSKIIVLVAVALVLVESGFCSAIMTTGSHAPVFSLKDVDGKSYNLSDMKDKPPLVVIYFFDVDSRPSIEGLLILDNLNQKYKEADFNVWGITRSPKTKIRDFIKRKNIKLPVLLDETGISDLYDCKYQPTMYILGPELKILKHLEGIEGPPENIRIELAETKLEQKRLQIAGEISAEVLTKNPKNIKALEIKAKEYLNKEDYEKVKKIAEELITQKGPAEITGKLILAEIYMQKENINEALKIIEEVKKKAPNIAWPYVLKGDILYSQGLENEAVAEYQAATKAKEEESFYRAIAYDRLGLINFNKKQYDKALQDYANAKELNPLDIEPAIKGGECYEKQGKWDKALEEYKRAQLIDKNDLIVNILAKKSQEMLDLKKRDQRNQLIKELVEQHEEMKNRKEIKPKATDDWTTSRLMTLYFSNFEEVYCGIPVRQGLSSAVPEFLEKELIKSGRVYIVPQDILNELLVMLKLGTSDLSHPKTRLEFGKLFATKIIVTAKLYYYLGYTELSLKLTDVETGLLKDLIFIQIKPGTSVNKELKGLKGKVLSSIVENYPLQAKVTAIKDSQVTLNIGSEEGVVPGRKFNIVDDDEEPFGQIEITKIKSGKCDGQIIFSKKPVKKDDKLQETIEISNERE